MRKHPVSQYSSEKLGLAVYVAGVLTDSNALPTIVVQLNSATIASYTATKDSTGHYSVALTAPVTNTKGDYVVTWSFTVGASARTYVQTVQVVDSMPFWSNLKDSEKLVVESIYLKVADTFDSTEGGPYLWETLQKTFNAWEVVSRLMSTDAVSYISLMFNPVVLPPYTVGQTSTKQFPTEWYGLLEKATYVEFLKHLSRSYIEIPDAPGVSVARLDRRRYRDEWSREAKEEKETLDRMLKMLKRTFITRRRSMLVSGGIFPLSLIDPSRPSWLYVPVRY